MSHLFDALEEKSLNEATGQDTWLIEMEDGQEVTVIPQKGTDSLYEAAQWDHNGYGVRVKGWCTVEDVKSFIEDVRGNWGESNPDVCEDFKADGSCIHSEHTK
jgi:hypothetical protein